MDELLKYLPLVNLVGVIVYYLIVKKIDEGAKAMMRVEVGLAATAATLAAHVAEDLRQFDQVQRRMATLEKPSTT
jgi:hypothetical protein